MNPTVTYPAGQTSRLRWPAVVIFVCSVAVTFVKLLEGYDSSWAPVSTLMFHPWDAPVFGHRLLFVAIAWVFRLLIPSLSAVYCYYLSQIMAMVWSFLMVGLLVREVVGPYHDFAAYPLLALMLIPTLRYFTFYDIGIVGFYAACLLLLLRDDCQALFFATFALGLFNHENLLLFAPVAVLYPASLRNYRKAAVLGASILAIYLSSRLALGMALPWDRSFDWRLPQNLHPLAYYGFKRLLISALSLLLPVCSIAVGFRNSHRLLKMAAPLLLAGLALALLLFGQWTEPRQFDALFAVAVPMLLSADAARGTSRLDQPPP